MKINFTRIAILLALVVFGYTACKKTEIKTVAKTTTDYAALSSRIAVSFYKSITGQYGGANINSGIKAPTNLAASKNARSFSTLAISPLCGFTIDTSYNYNQTVVDTTINFSGNFHFVYTCSSNVPDGYLVRDSITNTYAGGAFNNVYTVAQDYKVQALDKSYKKVSMNGYNYSAHNNRILQGDATLGFDYVNDGYKLQGLVVDFSSGVADVISGTASFNDFEYNDLPGGPLDGTETQTLGTIQFLGNHKAELTTGGKSYMVNLLTGVVTPI